MFFFSVFIILHWSANTSSFLKNIFGHNAVFIYFRPIALNQKWSLALCSEKFWHLHIKAIHTQCTLQGLYRVDKAWNYSSLTQVTTQNSTRNSFQYSDSMGKQRHLVASFYAFFQIIRLLWANIIITIATESIYALLFLEPIQHKTGLLILISLSCILKGIYMSKSYIFVSSIELCLLKQCQWHNSILCKLAHFPYSPQYVCITNAYYITVYNPQHHVFILS